MCDPVSGTLMAIGAVTQIAGGVMGMSADNKIAKGQYESQVVSAQQQRVQQIRHARIRAAQITQAAANTGAQESSSAISGAGNAVQTANQNIGVLGNEQKLAMNVLGAQEQANTSSLIEGIGSVFESAGAKLQGSQDG